MLRTNVSRQTITALSKCTVGLLAGRFKNACLFVAHAGTTHPVKDVFISISTTECGRPHFLSIWKWTHFSQDGSCQHVLPLKAVVLCDIGHFFVNSVQWSLTHITPITVKAFQTSSWKTALEWSARSNFIQVVCLEHMSMFWHYPTVTWKLSGRE